MDCTFETMELVYVLSNFRNLCALVWVTNTTRRPSTLVYLIFDVLKALKSIDEIYRFNKADFLCAKLKKPSENFKARYPHCSTESNYIGESNRVTILGRCVFGSNGGGVILRFTSAAGPSPAAQPFIFYDTLTLSRTLSLWTNKPAAASGTPPRPLQSL